MKRKVEELTSKQLRLLQTGITLYRSTLERLFSLEFLQKHKTLESAKIVLNDDDKGYFFTLEDEFGTLLCSPDYEAINLEYMLQDLCVCGVLKD